MSFSSHEPLVSVIVPVHNGGRFIDEALSSLEAQSWSRWEALVIDDGSTDDTAEQLQHRARRDERFRPLHHPQHANRGVSRSRRLGISHSAGELIAFLDADDAWRADKLERQITAMRSPVDTPGPVLCHTGVHVVNENPSTSTLHYDAEFNFANEPMHYDPRRQPWFGESSPICTSSVLCRAEPLQHVARGFDQMFQYEDWTWWTLMSTQGQFAFVPEPLTRYRVHEAAATARVQAEPLREVYSKLEHWLAVATQTTEADLRELAMRRLSITLGEAAAHYGPGSTAHEPVAALDRAALLERLGECERELARLRRFWPRRLVGWWRRRRERRRLR